MKVTLDLPAALHRDLIAYADLLTRAGGHPVEPSHEGGETWRANPEQNSELSTRIVPLKIGGADR